jgi:ribosome-binding factor A
VSRRTERIASLIRSILAEAIQSRLSDPRIEPLTSVTRVEVSADLSVAHVYVSVMAEDARRELSVSALQHAAGWLRSVLAQEATLRQTPQLDFRLDESVRRSFETVQQLDEMMRELDEGPGGSEEPAAGHGAPAGSDREQTAEPADETAAREQAVLGERDAGRNRRGDGAGEVPKAQEDA